MKNILKKLFRYRIWTRLALWQYLIKMPKLFSPTDPIPRKNIEDGDVVVVTKDFYYDGQFKKFINHSDPSQKPNWFKISKGEELIIVRYGGLENGDKINFYHSKIGGFIVKYSESHDYWSKKSDIVANNRQKQLEILGI